MNYLNTNFNGKFPWFLDDWRFQIDELYNALKQVTTALSYVVYPNSDPGQQGFILTGCIGTDTGTHLNISPGWVVLQGEPCYFEGISILKSSLPTPPPPNYFRLVPYAAPDPSKPKIMGNSNIVYPYEIRKAICEYPNPTNPGVDIDFDGSILKRTASQQIQELIGLELNHYEQTNEYDIATMRFGRLITVSLSFSLSLFSE